MVQYPPNMIELETLTITNPRNLWREIIDKINLRQDVVLPVKFVDEKDLNPFGKFHASLTSDGGKNYLQLENFDSPEWTEVFFKAFEGDWEICPGGIYRLEL